VAARRFLRVDEIAVDDHLEHASARRNQLDVGAEFFSQLGRQTGGTIFVTSDRAVLDRHFHDLDPIRGEAWGTLVKLVTVGEARDRPFSFRLEGT
jgi:hypothetical protein